MLNVNGSTVIRSSLPRWSASTATATAVLRTRSPTYLHAVRVSKGEYLLSN